MSEHRTLLRSASLITVITLLSRVLGYLRDLRFAFLLGAGVGFDAFVIAYRIPNLLRRLVGEGAVSAAFIPIFSRYLSSENRKEAWSFANAMITIATSVMSVVVVLGVLLSPWIVRVLAAGFLDTPGKIELTTLLNRIIFPYILLISLSALAMGVLNSFNKFATPAFAPVLLNLSIIGFSFASELFPRPELALAVGVVVGGVAQVLIQVPQLRRMGWRFRPLLDFSHPGVRQAGRLLAPVVLGVGVVQVNVVVDSLFGSFLGDGAVTAIHLSDRVMELVLGGYTIAIATVILPMMSRQAAENRRDEMLSTLNFASRIILFITVPSTVGLVVLRRPIIQVLFEHGEFGPASTELTAWPLMFFALGLSAFSMVKVIVPAFYSLEDTKTPVKVAFVAMFLNVALNLAFFHPLGVGGPALATTLSGFFNAATLMFIFVRREGSFGLRSILGSLVRFGLAAVPLGFLASALIHWPGFYFEQPLTQRVFALGTTIGLSAVVYFVAVSVLRCREVGEIREIFVKRRTAG